MGRRGELKPDSFVFRFSFDFVDLLRFMHLLCGLLGEGNEGIIAVYEQIMYPFIWQSI